MTHSTEHKHDSPRTPRATYQDVLDAPEHRVAEIVDGTLHVSPRPPTLAALAKTRLSAGLGRAFDRGRDGPGGWWIFHEPELHFGEDVLVPDVTGWRRERMPKLPDTDYVSLAPDWACEVLSPATRRLDLVDKRSVYAREGVPHLWLVDPADRTLEAYELRDGEWVLIATAKDDDPVSIRPVRRDHLQPWRSMGRRSERTATCLTVGPRESRSRPLWGANHSHRRAKTGPIGRFPG